MNYPLNSTDVSLIVQIVDDSGLPVEGLVAADFPSVAILRGTSTAALALVDLASVASAHTDGGLKEFANGRYRLDIPDSYFAVTGVMSLVAEELDKRLLHPELYIGSTVAAGEGPRSVSIKVTDGTDPIQNAIVRLHLNAENYRSVTNASGIVANTFGLINDGTWNVIVSASGYDSVVTTLAVNADIAEGAQVYELTANTPPAATDPTRCRVSTHIYSNGAGDSGAKFEARLIGSNNAVDGIIVRESLSDTADGDGLAYLDLIRQDQFVDGPGKYAMTITGSNGKVLFQSTVTIPNASSAILEDLI